MRRLSPEARAAFLTLLRGMTEREDCCSSSAERGALHDALVVSTSESADRNWSTIAFSPIDRDGCSRPGTGVAYRTVRSSHFSHQRQVAGP